MEEEEKKINIYKVIITVIAVLAIIVLIAILTKYLTNKKEATYVSSEELANASTNAVVKPEENTVNTQNEVWKIDTGTQSNTTTNLVENNTANNQVQNTTVNETTNSQAENNTATNESVTNQTENTTANVTTTNTVNNSTAKDKKDSKDVKGVIWLTFDDGPSANITPKILDILKKENIKATFFIINYSDSNEHLLKREAAEGHTIGIHGYSHEYSKIYKSKETFMNNVYTLQNRIQKSTGVKSMYTRFPGGSSNTVSRKYCKGIMTELTKEMLAKGFKYYDWNISSGDAGGAKNAKDVYNNVTKNLSKKRGNMVLMHDFGANKKGLEALPDIIKYAKKEGYKFAAIDDDTPMYAQHVNN